MNAMQSVELGQSALRISRLGLGCWAIGGHGWGDVDEDESIQAVRQAYDRGITLFDTADVYGFGRSERVLRAALGNRCREVVISSKFGVRWDDNRRTWKDISPAYMRRALDASLRRLKLDSISLYYVHWPDGKTPIPEIMAELARCREQGKILAIGVSNFSLAQLRAALSVTTIDAIQVQMNAIERRHAEPLLPLCRREKTVLVTWGSLADGLLTGKLNAETRFPESDHRSRSPGFQGELFRRNLERVEVLREIACNRGVTVAQVALRWLLDTSGVGSALFGAKRPSQVDENLGTLDWSLTREEYETIETCCAQCMAR